MVVSADLFDKESSVSQSSSHLFCLMILQQLDLTIRYWRVLNSSSNANMSSSAEAKIFFVHAHSLALLLKATWLRKDEDGFKKVEILIEEKNSVELLDSLLCFLDKIELIKFDVKKKYDRTLIPVANKQHGYVN